MSRARWLVVGALVAPLALSVAQDATLGRVQWTTATKYEDGAALPESDIAGALIEWGPKGGPYTRGSALVALPVTEFQAPALGTGATCFIARTVLTDAAAARIPSEKYSRASGEVCVTVPTRPAAPVLRVVP